MKRLSEEESIGDIAEAVGPLLHELGNLLNTIVLQVSTLEREVPEEAKPRLHSIREAGRTAAKHLRQFSNFRSSKYPSPYPLDLNAILKEVIAQIQPGKVEVDLQLASNPLTVQGSEAEWTRLVRLLLQNSLRSLPTEGGKVTLQTHQQDEQVILSLRDNGPQIAEGKSSRMFDPFHPPRENYQGFEMASCESLARRLRGHIRLENSPGGLTVILEIPVAKAKR